MTAFVDRATGQRLSHSDHMRAKAMERAGKVIPVYEETINCNKLPIKHPTQVLYRGRLVGQKRST